jgi:cysteine desulfurase
LDIYLDNAATTRVCPEAADMAYRVMTEQYGNPSSTHARGREAKKLLDAARRELALCLGCQPKELAFTSCGSEADNWALLSGAWAASARGGHVISSMAEHDAVRKSLDELERRGYEVTRLPPDPSGAVPVQAVLDALRPDTVLVSLMLVNNETGAVNDIPGLARALKKAAPKVLLHCDAVQGFLKVPFTVKSLGADMVTISGHKIHAPKGIGALYIRSGLHLRPLILGGSQEDGRRAGTEAMPAICAFGEAARLGRALMAESTERMAGLRQRAVSRLLAENPGLVVIGGGAPHILCVSLPGYRSEVLMSVLESRGISVSKSSACKKGGRSHVLEAMGLPAPVIDGALRLGLSRYTTAEELDAFCLCLREARETLAHA